MSDSHDLQDQYIHGYSPDEQQRLSRMNQLLNQRCLQKMQLVHGQKVLDVGCGLGIFSAEIASLLGSEGSVLGIEKSEHQLARANQLLAHHDNLEFRRGSAYDLPLESIEWGSFDVTFTRFLLEHLKEPSRAVIQMIDATKSGGKIILIDDDHAHFTCYPPPPHFHEIWQAYLRSYDRLGNDPFVGRRLVSLLRTNEVSHIQNEVIFFGSSADDPAFPAFVDNIIEIVGQARTLMTEQGLITTNVLDSGLAALEEWKSVPEAAIWYYMNIAIGTKG